MGYNNDTHILAFFYQYMDSKKELADLLKEYGKLSLI